MSLPSAVLTSASVERVRQALERSGVKSEIIELPGAARTARAAAAFLGCDPAQIANSLVFRTTERNAAILVMSCGARRVDVDRLAQHLGEGVAKADAGFVREHTGFAIGGVAPVGHGIRRSFVEATLSQYPALWAAAGHPHTVFRLTYPELVRITGGEEATLAE